MVFGHLIFSIIVYRNNASQLWVQFCFLVDVTKYGFFIEQVWLVVGKDFVVEGALEQVGPLLCEKEV